MNDPEGRETREQHSENELAARDQHGAEDEPDRENHPAECPERAGRPNYLPDDTSPGRLTGRASRRGDREGIRRGPVDRLDQ